MARERVVLAMSGGVDSSVSAHLLVEAGYDVVGLFLRTGAHEEPAEACEVDLGQPPKKIRGCCSAIDASDAQRVADRLDLPFYALDFKDDFDRIKDYFADEYSRGRTPNPCAVCNTWLKFGRLWEYADAIGADRIATGHYAQIVRGGDGAELHRGADPGKDQSYFLFGIARGILERLLFPVGHLPKSEVRRLAERYELGVHQKPDSQEICFVPTGDYQSFLRSHRPEAVGTPGPIVDTEGRELGQHEGISGFTIGQRKGLGVAVGEPRYVVRIEPEVNQVVIGPRELLKLPTLEADEVNWLIDPPSEPLRCEVKIRYLSSPAPATVERRDDASVLVRFDEPQSAITPGQAAVFYQGDRLLGGGWVR